MNKDKISQNQGIVMIVIFIMGSSTLMVSGLVAKQDVWISIILAILISLVIGSIYSKLLSYLPGKDIFFTLEFFLGKFLGKTVIFLITWFAFDLAAIVLRNFGQFIYTVGLPDTPMIIPMICLMILCAFAVNSGIETIAKWSMLFIIVLILFQLFTGLLLSKYFDLSNLKPILYNGIKPILMGSLGVISFPLAETVVFLFAFPPFPKEESPCKVFSLGFLIGGLIIFFSSLMDILVLGSDGALRTYYPTYTAASIIAIGGLFERIEVISATIFIVSIFLKVCVLFLAACKGITKLFGFKDYKFSIFPLSLLVLGWSYISFSNIAEYHAWINKVFIYYGPFFEVIVPLICFIIIEMKLIFKKS